MSETNQVDGKADTANKRDTRFTFRLIHLIYVSAVIASSLAVFGPVGLAAGVIVLVLWMQVFIPSLRLRTLVELLVVISVIAILVALLLPAVQMARGGGRRMMCSNNMKQILLALHTYHDTYGSWPPPYTTDASGKPLHSWRVLILPFVEHSPLFDQIKLDEPWNSKSNAQLAKHMPMVYRCPSHAREGLPAHHTCYVAVVGRSTIWSPDGTRFDEVIDGADRTLAVIEGNAPGVPWMKPTDLSLPEAIKMLAGDDNPWQAAHRSQNFFHEYSHGRMAGRVDGAVFWVGVTTHEAAESMFTIAGGDSPKPLDYDSFSRYQATRARYGNWFRLAVWLLIVVLPAPWAVRGLIRPRDSAHAPQRDRQSTQSKVRS